MAIMGVTETSAVALDEISLFVQAYLAENAKLLPTVLDRSPEARKGVKTIEYGRAGGFTAEDKVENTAYTAQVLTWATDVLNLTTNQGVYVMLENIASIQSMVDQEAQILLRATQALVDKNEAAIYTALKATSSSTPDHRVPFSSGTTLAMQDILKARKLLNIQNVPMMDRFLAINPEQEEDLLNLEQFLHADKYGSNSVLMNGEIGRIAGFTVIVSNNVTADECVAYHRDHVVFARQVDVTFKSMPNLENDAMEYLLSNLYGVKTLDSGKRGVLINASGS